MRKSILAALSAAVMMMTVSVSAQERSAENRERQKPTAEQMAQRLTERMTERLNLTPEQAKAVYALNYDRIVSHEKSAENRRADMAAQRESTAASRQKILTPEQSAAWQADMEQARKNHGKAAGQHGGWKGRGKKCDGNAQGECCKDKSKDCKNGGCDKSDCKKKSDKKGGKR
ncbi:MAG: DUF4890 domain-containing protein [Alistipes sp.]|nr:DUF4890 domain-containing protein [Alistipes sp.]